MMSITAQGSEVSNRKVPARNVVTHPSGLSARHDID